jgi:hypothetical protein
LVQDIRSYERFLRPGRECDSFQGSVFFNKGMESGIEK